MTPITALHDLIQAVEDYQAKVPNYGADEISMQHAEFMRVNVELRRALEQAKEVYDRS